MRVLLVLGFCIAAACSSGRIGPPSIAAKDSNTPIEKVTDVRFEQLASGVWMHTSYTELEGWGSFPSNGLIVENGSNSILVDTAWTDAQTSVILDWAEDVLSRPIMAAVFTHAHDDRMGGVAVVRARGIRTYAHPLSNSLAAERQLMPAEHALNFDRDGDAIGLGARKDLAPLEIYYPGAGHTKDNIVVSVVNKSILFGGCLIRPQGVTSLGNTADADTSNWDDSADRVAARFRDAQVIVPSHGPPAGRELLSLTADLARAVEATEWDCCNRIGSALHLPSRTG